MTSLSPTNPPTPKSVTTLTSASHGRGQDISKTTEPCGGVAKWRVFKAFFGVFGLGRSLWRTTSALDNNPNRPTRGAERDQAVVHALLRSKDQIPKQAPAPELKRRIASKLQEIEPVQARQAGVVDALRIGAVPACVAVMLAVGIHFATSTMSSSNHPKQTQSGSAIATGDADPNNPGAKPTSKTDARLKPLTQDELWVPIQFTPGTSKASRATDDASMSSTPIMREANSFQQAGEAIKEAIIRQLPPMPERPK